MLSGTYWEFSNQDSVGYKITRYTDIAAWPNFTVPGLSEGRTATGGGYDPICNRQVDSPAQYIESYFGTGIKGFGIFGTFGGQMIPGDDFGPGSSLYASAFFHERQCYDGGREYGFFYEPHGNSIWAYWGTNENTPSVQQTNIRLTGAYPGTLYYFWLYPTRQGASCGFQVTVLTSSYSTVFSEYYTVHSAITNADPEFCEAMTSSLGESGFASAGTIYTPTIANIPTSINLNLQRVFVGK
jgi:hypothetical protein